MKRRISIVEDNPDDADLSVAALRQQGNLDVTLVEDGVEALAYLTRTVGPANGEPELPDVVLLDLELPRMDGHELLEAIRKHPRLGH